ncbi:hypothetical protein DPMN_072134 [Dreissena polymorpha]|uniref:IRG-type G domain-containing protein n=1 Tax=Dreissena polymorpha TaxID=45954 RepID=A0A9D3Z5R5_DREPO|nr:hypothetical protein DPMN_072134 [Dreissena polymorpha]
MTDKCAPGENRQTTNAKLETTSDENKNCGLQLKADDEESDDNAMEDELEALRQKMQMLESRNKLKRKKRKIQRRRENVESVQDASQENCCEENVSIPSVQTNEANVPGKYTEITLYTRADQATNTSDINRESEDLSALTGHDFTTNGEVLGRRRSDDHLEGNDGPNADDLPPRESIKAYLTEMVREHGISGIAGAINDDLNKLKTIPISICVIGETGAGKSSFINSIRGLKASDNGAACVGVGRTTITIAKYPHPRYPNIIYYDVPGLASLDFPRSEYLKSIQINTYDFFILIYDGKFKENQKWLLEEIRKTNKQLYFVRAKIDQDVTNQKRDHGSEPNETIEKVREDCYRNLEAIGVSIPSVFLISNHHVHEYEFNSLKSRLINDAAGLQKEALMMSMTSSTKWVLEEKKKLLKQRIFKVAIMSSLGALVPIPGVGILTDFAIIFDELKHYKNELGTDEESLLKIAQQIKVPIEALITKYNIHSSVISKSIGSFTSFCAVAAVTYALTNVSKLVLPVIGSVVSAAAAYPIAVYLQLNLLNMCFEEALRIHDLHMQLFFD